MAAEAARPYDELMDEVAKAGGASLYLCYQCGVCTATCPWSLVRDESLRKMLRLTQLGLGGLEGDFLWRCTTCRACVARCPRGVDVIEVIRAARGFVAGMGMEPDPLKTARGHLASVGNPWGGAPEARGGWAEGLRVPRYEKGMDVLLYVGCTAAYDTRARNVARALVRVLDAAGVSYGILGKDEPCCGDAALSIGDREGFNAIAANTSALFRDRGVGRIVAVSPHCYTAFKKEYPKVGGEFEVEHHTELLARLVDEDRLAVRGEGTETVTYQDPCYLGRHNDVYEAPRKVLETLPGVDMEEMESSRGEALCCGGGGGRIFQETPPEERFSAIRVDQAGRTGAQTLATACPYCLLTLEDSAKTVSSSLAVRDIAEIVADALAR